MPKIKVLTEKPYFMNVPEWFMNNRFNGTTHFSNEENCWIATEIPTYTQIKKFMMNFSKEDIFLDIGAQMGLCTLPIAAEGYEVIAVEPVQANISLLTTNLIENDFLENVQILPFAAHSVEKQISIFVPTEEDCASLSEAAAVKIGKEVTEQTVTTVVLDEKLMSQEERIRFIKIDVQGAEIDVLRGMKQLLSKSTQRYIFTEWDPGYMKNYGSSPEEMHEFFTSVGYKRVYPLAETLNGPLLDFNGDAMYSN